MDKSRDAAWLPWQLNSLSSSIEALSAEDRQAVQHAIDAILVNPYSPEGFSVRPLKKVKRRQRWLLTLPGGIAIQYEPVTALPPIMRKIVLFWSIATISLTEATDARDQ